EMIIGKDLSPCKYAYSKWLGKYFSLGSAVSLTTEYGVLMDAIHRIGSLESLSVLQSTGLQPSRSD
ncbi:hypothetical protein Tco_1416773, partial [Tanacetum coccineum]